MAFLELRGVKKDFRIQKSVLSRLVSKQKDFVHAVDGIDLTLE